MHIEEKWILPEACDPQAAESLSAQLGIRPILADLLIRRGIHTPEEAEDYIHPAFSGLHDAGLLFDGKKAAAILKEKISSGKRIRVIGDYDIDGVCATYILVTAIRENGGIVDAAIPDRITDGYGLNERLVRMAVEDGIDTIITCDNGISAISQIQLAKENGLTVIVTDHHEPALINGKQVLPPADAIVDPHQENDTYPFSGICGAVVAWKVMQLLYIACDKPRQILYNLSFAAFATIGDVMELSDENRIIVYYGLQALDRSANPGMHALIRQTGIKDRGDRLNTYHVGFVLGPCLNAAGRLETAKQSLNLFLEKDSAAAHAIAAHLIELNTQRQEITRQGIDEAMEQLNRSDTDPAVTNNNVLVIYLPGSSESVVGIIAGKIRERTGRPTFILTDAQGIPGMLKGSGRSIPEYNMFIGISEAKEAGILSGGGGHPMAAGITVEKEKLDALRIYLNTHAHLTADDVSIKVRPDTYLPIACVSEALIRELTALEPCGTGNHKPLFMDEEVHLAGLRIMGANRNVIRLQLNDETGMQIPGIMFGDGDAFVNEIRARYGEQKLSELFQNTGRDDCILMDIVYIPQINTYRDMHAPELRIVNYRWRN